MNSLTHAAYVGDLDYLKRLLAAGADINEHKNDWGRLGKPRGRTSLALAAEQGHDEIARYLLDQGAKTDIGDDSDETPLMLASSFGHETIVRLLVEKNADVNLTDKEGDTALERATIRGYGSIVKLLVERGADLELRNKLGITALMFSAGNDHIDLVRYLLEKGAKMDTVSKDGKTALDYARLSKRKEVTALLEEWEAKKNASPPTPPVTEPATKVEVKPDVNEVETVNTQPPVTSGPITQDQRVAPPGPIVCAVSPEAANFQTVVVKSHETIQSQLHRLQRQFEELKQAEMRWEARTQGVDETIRQGKKLENRIEDLGHSLGRITALLVIVIFALLFLGSRQLRFEKQKRI